MTAVPEDLLRELVPQVLGALVRRYGHFDTAEDAVQEALLAAARQWPATGPPENPRAWLITVAARRLTDLLRADEARRRREWALTVAPAESTDADDSLVLLFLCCHPALSVPAQLSLTLKAVGGLSTAEVARALLVPETTMARRITRAKTAIRDSGATFRLPSRADWDNRLAVVLRVLYLIFNEGYASQRTETAAEAIRLTRLLHRLLPADSEVTGLLALMLLTHARRDARATADGAIIPMDAQDRTRWDAAAIAEGIALITAALPSGPTGPYQLQAAIAAVHDEATAAADTDWPQIEALYGLLLRVDPSPVVRLNHAVAVAMARGPHAGLALLDDVPQISHRWHAARAHLLELAGDRPAAHAAYLTAAAGTASSPEQRYLRERAARLSDE
ncbi:RNA polymerase sigma factor [Catenuloplanes sp. NPDC051500]|uniref:RNA polymerase sigma factor n=1 Tax=Catenuloplanes sp. NPDC051500 TaxID=3363959 RepID=UPI0037B9FD3F